MKKILLALACTLAVGSIYAGDCTIRTVSHVKVIPLVWQIEQTETETDTLNDCRAMAHELLGSVELRKVHLTTSGYANLNMKTVKVKYKFDDGENVVKGNVRREIRKERRAEK